LAGSLHKLPVFFMRHKGKLIVIDGSDGVGKATQTKLLVERLRKDKIPVATLDFPQYESNFFGKLVGGCLAGKYGNFVALDPHIASVLYAADRFESKAKIEKWLAEGKVVVLDRYVSANQMHQGGKIRDARARKNFLVWLDQMEHGVFGLPRPDLILCLHLPLDMSLQLLSKKTATDKKTYLGKGVAKDTVESDARYLLNAQEGALRLVKAHNNWQKVTCAHKDAILPREDIHERIWAIVRKHLPR